MEDMECHRDVKNELAALTVIKASKAEEDVKFHV